jgi:hypothetical protein
MLCRPQGDTQGAGQKGIEPLLQASGGNTRKRIEGYLTIATPQGDTHYTGSRNLTVGYRIGGVDFEIFLLATSNILQ